MASILRQNSYNPADIYNMDETGYAISATQSTRVLAVLEKEKLARKGAPRRQEWVTSIECVSAAGRALPPLVIFKGGSFNSGWLPAGQGDAVKGWDGLRATQGGRTTRLSSIGSRRFSSHQPSPPRAISAAYSSSMATAAMSRLASSPDSTRRRLTSWYYRPIRPISPNPSMSGFSPL